jgi:ubiquinone biosynthesis protein Coq4
MATESLRRNGHDYPLLTGLAELVTAIDEVRDREQTERMIQNERSANEKLDAWFAERFISTYTLDDLGRNPAGSIGRQLHDHMASLGLSVELLPQRMADPDWAPKSDIDYFTLRSGQTHDFDHLIGEVGFDVVAEPFTFGLRTGNMFAHVSPELAGALQTTISFVILPWLTRAMLHYPAAWPKMWENINYGYEMGSQSEMLFTVKWEDYLHLSPAEAREALGVRGFRGPSSSEEASLVFGEGKLII